MLALVLLAALALATRVLSLGANGLAEDEMDKLHGAEDYRQGVFTADGEHPALMKLAVAASLVTADAWNRAAHVVGVRPISIEAAVRLPNAVAGAATTIVLYLLVEQFFTPLIAMCAAWFWAFDLGAVATSRIAKEDTFVLLFLLLAALLYERGKRVGVASPRMAQRWFAAAGAAFGLMMASKYLPYLFGIHVLYFRAAEPHPGRNRPDKPIYFGAMAVGFLIANFPILWPGNWATIATFLDGHAVEHSGYVFQGTLWPNALWLTPRGVPVWFYLADLVTKTPLAVLAAVVVGLVALVGRRRERGAVFVWTFLLLTLVPYSLVATKFLRYLLPTRAMLDIIAALGVVWVMDQAAHRAPRWRMLAAAGGAVVMLTPAIAWVHAQPFVSLYRNALGTALAPSTLWFPPDELYDAGLREAVEAVAARAPRGAIVVTEAPAVAAFYAARDDRSDLLVRYPAPGDPQSSEWFIVQPGRIYFENRAAVDRARQSAPVIAVDVNRFRAAEVYHGGRGDRRGPIVETMTVWRRPGSAPAAVRVTMHTSAVAAVGE
ncbi:MAG TPA: glycosyltransferase family 39 protein [Vicinamibacterales bacterium]|nr:glycosyltransferase family 39 protein [Vicinamibacterales bacterium]